MSIDQKKEKVFGDIYQQNAWGGDDSRSGPGSNLEQTAAIRKKVPALLSQYQVKSVLDIPCGDFYWMKEIKPELDKILTAYIGGDIVKTIVDSNAEKYQDAKFSFRLLDITSSDLPKVDVVLSRDCLVHFSYRDIFLALRRVQASGSKYLLTTSFSGKGRKNRNIATGDWRPVNFERYPFFFPAPVDIIIEECTENNGIYSDKSLVLWKVKSINLLVLRMYLLLSALKKKIRG